MSEEILKLLPQQWIGVCVLMLFIVYILGQVTEKYEHIAKLLPLGKWWHERNKRKSEIDPAALTKALEEARRAWGQNENAAMATLEGRVAIIAAVSDQQAQNIKELQGAIRCFTAFSTYDARWHHRADINLAECPNCHLPEHLDYFSFEQLWIKDPIAASRLPA